MLRIRHIAFANHSGGIHSAAAFSDGDIYLPSWDREPIGDDKSGQESISYANCNIKHRPDADPHRRLGCLW
jgi:hypothetical protein